MNWSIKNSNSIFEKKVLNLIWYNSAGRPVARISLPFVNCDKTVCHLQSYQRELFFPLKWNSSQTPECDRSFFIESCERDTRRWSSKFLHSEKFSQTYYLCADTFETRSGSFPNSLCQRPGCWNAADYFEDVAQLQKVDEHHTDGWDSCQRKKNTI